MIYRAPKQAADNSVRRPGLPPGRNYLLQGSSWTSVDSGTWRTASRRLRCSRSWYYQQRQSRGMWYQCRRPAGVSGVLVTLAPWWSAVVDRELLDGACIDPFLAEFVALAADAFEGATGRLVLGVGLHLDTRVIHCDLLTTRVDERRQLCGHKWLGFVGPWATGVMRQVRAGFRDPGEPKAVAARRAVARELSRHPEFMGELRDLPGDVQIAWAVDDLCEGYFGQSRFVDFEFAMYRESFRRVARGHALRKIEALAQLREVV